MMHSVILVIQTYKFGEIELDFELAQRGGYRVHRAIHCDGGDKKRVVVVKVFEGLNAAKVRNRNTYVCLLLMIVHIDRTGQQISH